MNERRDFPGLHTPGPTSFLHQAYQQQHHHLHSPTNLNAAAAANNNAISNSGPFYIPQGTMGTAAAMRYMSNPSSSLAMTNANPNNSPPEGHAVSPGPPHPLPPRMNMGFRSEPLKRKRGRPRKYSSDEVGLGLSPVTPSSHSLSEKRPRGSSSGSNKKIQMAALGSAGHGFTPHIITIAKGEDVSKKISAFLQQGPWAVCVLSANGSISNVVLQTAMANGPVTYEGRFEIVSLSGSFVLTEAGGNQERTGGLTVSLARADGSLVGGSVAGLLIAASPVQVVLGTFLTDAKKGFGRTENSEPSGGALPASISGRPSSPAALQSRTEAFGGLRTDEGGYCEQTTGGGSYTMTSEMLNNMNMQPIDWGSQFQAEARSNAEGTMSGGQRTIDLDSSYWSKGKEDEDHVDQIDD